MQLIGSKGNNSVLVRVTIVMNHHDQGNFGKKWLIWLMLRYLFSSQRKSRQELKQGRYLEAGADVEAMLTGLLYRWLAQS